MSEFALKPERDFAGRQCLGKRTEQEDSFAFLEIAASEESPFGLLIVVADGMGGHIAGHEASDLAVRSFVTTFQSKDGNFPARLSAALHAANTAISDAIKESPVEFGGMGTTLLAASVTPEGLSWISVGDSPLYLFRAGQLQRINEDHSFRPVLHEMVERGEISEEQAAHSTLRNRLRAALTGDEIALVSASEAPFPLRKGDLILAASDGIQTLNDATIANAIEEARGTDAAEIATRLLQAVLNVARAKQDNATAAILMPPAAWLDPRTPESENPEETKRVSTRKKRNPTASARSDSPPP